MPQVRVTIPKKGISTGKVHPQIDAVGFTGGACLAATAGYEAALGGTQDRHVKAEMSEEAQLFEMEHEEPDQPNG